MVGLPYGKKKLWRYIKPFSYNTSVLRTDGRTDRQTELLYQYRASVCWRAIKTKRTAACNSHHKSSRPSYATADFEEAPLSDLQQVFGTATVAGYWFHYAQADIKRLTKIGLRDAHLGNQDVQKIVRCLLSLPLLLPAEIVQAVSNILLQIADDGQHVKGLKKLVAYINKQWINKRSVGPERLSIRNNRGFALTK